MIFDTPDELFETNHDFIGAIAAKSFYVGHWRPLRK